MKLAVLEPLGVEKEKFLEIGKKALGDSLEIELYDNRIEDTKTLIERSKDADIVMLSNFKFDREVMQHCPNLKMVCVAFTGFDHVDMEYCNEHNIIVTNASGYANIAVAEIVFGLIISLYRNIIPCDKATREGGTKDGLVGCELMGKTFGVIGSGAIGKTVVNIAKVFGCNVIVYNGDHPVDIDGVEVVNLEELMKKSDIVSLHTPLNDSTRDMINKDRLAMMKKSAIIINAARGPIINTRDLADALNNGVIAGAGIDVFDEEPPISKADPLLIAKNTVLTPHVAFATKESMVKRAIIAFDNIKSWIDGKPQNVVK